MKFIKKKHKLSVLAAVLMCLVFFGAVVISGDEYLDKMFATIKNWRINNNEIQGQQNANELYENSEEESIKKTIEDISRKFIVNCFSRNETNLRLLLAGDTDYIKSPDGSAFIRYRGEGQLVEGYMDTDKNLEKYRQRWCYVDKDKALAGVEIFLRGQDMPVIWYLHYRKEGGQWKLYMLENDYVPKEPAL